MFGPEDRNLNAAVAAAHAHFLNSRRTLEQVKAVFDRKREDRAQKSEVELSNVAGIFLHGVEIPKITGLAPKLASEKLLPVARVIAEKIAYDEQNRADAQQAALVAALESLEKKHSTTRVLGAMTRAAMKEAAQYRRRRIDIAPEQISSEGKLVKPAHVTKKPPKRD